MMPVNLRCPFLKGVLPRGDAQIQASDVPGADVIASTGVGAGHPNVTAVVALDVTTADGLGPAENRRPGPD
ncbi:hypothetical protein GA0061078_1507 [Bifidobacterium bohemicum]|uniref:Uncharacterized protein n=1 Tax=Bifidobacterium bohemicum DSM 22767 TaxID=1437606 RepID=A0A086ZGX0_9BIFI|nr:hypothetical protein BBOH_0572 [Bifidobacterium bohemicum DSM 22767]SCC11529.1 hypothetical protein GA0061078_1507 [Bifidobacterium bohemicum]